DAGCARPKAVLREAGVIAQHPLSTYHLPRVEEDERRPLQRAPHYVIQVEYLVVDEDEPVVIAIRFVSPVEREMEELGPRITVAHAAQHVHAVGIHGDGAVRSGDLARFA